MVSGEVDGLSSDLGASVSMSVCSSLSMSDKRVDSFREKDLLNGFLGLPSIDKFTGTGEAAGLGVTLATCLTPIPNDDELSLSALESHRTAPNSSPRAGGIRSSDLLISHREASILQHTTSTLGVEEPSTLRPPGYPSMDPVLFSFESRAPLPVTRRTPVSHTSFKRTPSRAEHRERIQKKIAVNTAPDPLSVTAVDKHGRRIPAVDPPVIRSESDGMMKQGGPVFEDLNPEAVDDREDTLSLPPLTPISSSYFHLGKLPSAAHRESNHPNNLPLKTFPLPPLPDSSKSQTRVISRPSLRSLLQRKRAVPEPAIAISLGLNSFGCKDGLNSDSGISQDDSTAPRNFAEGLKACQVPDDVSESSSRSSPEPCPASNRSDSDRHAPIRSPSSRIKQPAISIPPSEPAFDDLHISITRTIRPPKRPIHSSIIFSSEPAPRVFLGTLIKWLPVKFLTPKRPAKTRRGLVIQGELPDTDEKIVVRVLAGSVADLRLPVQRVLRTLAALAESATVAASPLGIRPSLGKILGYDLIPTRELDAELSAVLPFSLSATGAPMALCVYSSFIPLQPLTLQLKPGCESLAQGHILSILSSLHFLHTRGLFHGAVIPPNILSDGNVTILREPSLGTISRLSLDSSSSLGYGIDRFALERSGKKLLYAAPESLGASGDDRDLRSEDIWQLGCFVLELLTAKPPAWSEASNGPLALATEIGVSERLPKIQDDLSVSPACLGFIKLCLIKDPCKRPDAAALLNHSWMR